MGQTYFNFWQLKMIIIWSLHTYKYFFNYLFFISYDLFHNKIGKAQKVSALDITE